MHIDAAIYCRRTTATRQLEQLVARQNVPGTFHERQ